MPAELRGTPQGSVAGGDLKSVERLVAEGLSVDTRDSQESTLLHVAAIHGRLAVAGFLLGKGADPVAKDQAGRTPLHGAAFATHWFSPEARRGMRIYGASGSEHPGVAELLLSRGADVHARDRYGYTPLHLAAEGGNLEVARLLIDRGADVNARTDTDSTPLHKAAAGGNHENMFRIEGDHAEVARLLLARGADRNAVSVVGTALSDAIRSGATDVADVLLGAQTETDLRTGNGSMALRDAVWKGDIELVRRLLDRGAPLEAMDLAGRTPLLSAAEAGKVTILALLLERGARLEVRDALGRTPAHGAASSGSVATLRFLLDRGADVLARDGGGNTLLHDAASGCFAGEEMVAFLLEKGVELDAKNANGQTPLALAESADCLVGGAPALGPLRRRGALR